MAAHGHGDYRGVGLRVTLSVWPDEARLASLVDEVGAALRLTARRLALMAFGSLVISLFSVLIGGAFPAAAFGSPACTVYDSPMYTYGSASMQCRTHSEPGARRGPPLAAVTAVAGTPVSIHALGVAAKAAPSAQEIIETTARAQATRGGDALSGALSSAEQAAMEFHGVESGTSSRS